MILLLLCSSLIIILINLSFLSTNNRKLPETNKNSAGSPSRLGEMLSSQVPYTLKTPITLSTIFDDSVNQASESIVLLTTGDVMLGRSVNFIATSTQNFDKPWEQVWELIKNADIAFINLEGPLGENCPLTNEGMRFCSDPGNAQSMSRSGVDVASLANNHIGDYGSDGIETTKSALNEAGILTSGTNETVAKTVNGVRFAFLGFNDIPPFNPQIKSAKTEVIQTSIASAKKEADVVIAAFHWGNEYTNLPTKRQREFAHLAIDFGADIVVGNHPHWIQPIEIYKDKVIVYSHGNFIFDQTWSLETRQGIVSKLIFDGKNLVDVEILPVQQDKVGQPYLLSGKSKEEILNKMREQSFNLAN